MHVVSFGEILWDVLGTDRTLGGAPANLAFHARQLGMTAALVSAVGDDPLGREILTRLRDWDVDHSAVAVLADRPTGTVDVRLDAAGQASYTITPEVAWDAIPVPADLAAFASRADALCFGTLAQRSPGSREALLTLLRSVRPGTLRVLDVNLRPTGPGRDVLRASAATCDVLKMSDAEIPEVAACFDLPADERRLVRELFRTGVRVVAVTRGGNGSTIYDPNGASDLPAPSVRIADTIGAGDSFTATLVTGLLRGQPIDVVHRKAVAVSSYVCTQPGATPPLPAALLAGLERSG